MAELSQIGPTTCQESTETIAPLSLQVVAPHVVVSFAMSNHQLNSTASLLWW
ncbi:hypothetical protein IFO70_33935 [Phormidium tenue FACHB-886]|nr:hypothetical protein [Phormidium tenue FACHB-886]